MTRDYSSFFLTKPSTTPGPSPDPLAALGWHQVFATQIDTEALDNTPPVRVTEVHKSGLRTRGAQHNPVLPPSVQATVGDWVLYDAAAPHHSIVLDRKSLLKRRAAGEARSEQLIAANLDTIFIVSSCNKDFNVARLERYLALAFEAEIEPVIVLTKADLTDRAQTYEAQAASLSNRIAVVTLDARGDEPVQKLAAWCKPGQTVAFVGSSGVGKSTLTNAFLGGDSIATQGIREDDAKGRHTTTSRQLHTTPTGCLVIDTPGMRELQLTDVAGGIAELFEDLEALSHHCKFRDCSHGPEPGCALQAACDRGDLDPARLARWQKLVAEEAHNSATLAERRARDKAFGKMVRRVVKDSRKG